MLLSWSTDVIHVWLQCMSTDYLALWPAHRWEYRTGDKAHRQQACSSGGNWLASKNIWSVITCICITRCEQFALFHLIRANKSKSTFITLSLKWSSTVEHVSNIQQTKQQHSLMSQHCYDNEKNLWHLRRGVLLPSNRQQLSSDVCLWVRKENYCNCAMCQDK